MNRAVIIAAAALAAGVAVPASADTLNVQGVVAPYCNVNLTNVSSGTASIAMANVQTVANLRLSCNSPTGTKLTVKAQNGDLTNVVSGITLRINYDMILDSSDPSFAIAATDTYPNGGAGTVFVKQNAGYTQAIANGLPLVLSLNMNVQPDANNTPSSQSFPATAAPAGTYSEVFTFTASAV